MIAELNDFALTSRRVKDVIYYIIYNYHLGIKTTIQKTTTLDKCPIKKQVAQICGETLDRTIHQLATWVGKPLTRGP